MTKYHLPNKLTKAERAERERKRRAKIKWKVFKHYGGDPPKCACCGETVYEFLTVDHIENATRAERFIGRRASGRLYYWLLINNFPPGYQILCGNCNFAKGHYGECPHEKSKRLDAQIRIAEESMNAHRRSAS